MKYSFAFFVVPFIVLAACAKPPEKFPPAQYWQRSASSDAIYTQGPKAQDILSRDIASCVAELRELERLGILHDAIPSDGETGRVLDPDDPRLDLDEYEAPDRTSFLKVELGEYHDFEGCMSAKGWVRVEYLPYETTHISRENREKAMWKTTHPHVQDDYPAKRPPGNYKTNVND